MADDLYDSLMRDLRKSRDNGVNYKTAKATLRKIVDEDPERYLTMFFNNWFNNNWARKPVEESAPRRATAQPAAYKPRPKPTASELREQRKADANLRGLALMNMFLSDGETRLKDATGKQVRQESGWLILIAKHVKPTEIVGRKLTAEQLSNLKEQGLPFGKRVAGVEITGAYA